ncbi:hypothetical protein BD414DRAFT_266257 [Trametes punicea]|nr:hypothetical protein BD414DRAFT_266257 [Trametes punicea]
MGIPRSEPGSHSAVLKHHLLGISIQKQNSFIANGFSTSAKPLTEQEVSQAIWPIDAYRADDEPKQSRESLSKLKRLGASDTTRRDGQRAPTRARVRFRTTPPASTSQPSSTKTTSRRSPPNPPSVPLIHP